MHVVICKRWMSIPIPLHVHLCLSDGLPPLQRSAHKCERTDQAVMQTLGHSYMRIHWTGHLAPATARLMQNTTRLGRWQLHQEAGPLQAKGPRGCKDVPGYEEAIRWALTAAWVDAQNGAAEQVEAGEERKGAVKR